MNCKYQNSRVSFSITQSNPKGKEDKMSFDLKDQTKLAHRIATALTGDPTLAEDIVQTVFLRMFKKRKNKVFFTNLLI